MDARKDCLVLALRTRTEAHNEYPERRQNASAAEDFAGTSHWNNSRNVDKGKNENAEIHTVPARRKISMTCVEEASRHDSDDKLNKEAYCKCVVQGVRYIIGYYSLSSRNIRILWRKHDEDAAGDDNKHNKGIKKRVLIEIDTYLPKAERFGEAAKNRFCKIQMKVGIVVNRAPLSFARRIDPVKLILHDVDEHLRTRSPFVKRNIPKFRKHVFVLLVFVLLVTRI